MAVRATLFYAAFLMVTWMKLQNVRFSVLQGISVRTRTDTISRMEFSRDKLSRSGIRPRNQLHRLGMS